jgi:hypothetical protein
MPALAALALIGSLVPGRAAGLLVTSIGVYSTRATFRYPIYRATVESTPAPYDLIPLAPFVVAWQIWSDLDRAEPFRIAYAVGWDNFNGHTAFRYPLLGSRLQNTVLYVPPTGDGEVIDYRERDRLLARLDFRAWVRRLIEQRVEIVVAAVPGVPKLGWMQSHPNVFVPFSKSPDGTWTWAFRLVSAEAEALVDASAPPDTASDGQD